MLDKEKRQQLYGSDIPDEDYSSGEEDEYHERTARSAKLSSAQSAYAKYGDQYEVIAIDDDDRRQAKPPSGATPDQLNPAEVLKVFRLDAKTLKYVHMDHSIS